ncbi:MAG TPA: protein kinase [Kofleriaceae bacterium]|nr:protein kinase [Kofleriaceae bacterium]
MNTAQDSSPPGEYYCPTCEKQYPAGERCPADGTRLVKLKVAIDPFIGRELDGRYTILEKLGQGGMGAVYRSSQHSVGRDCAIKVVSSHLVSEADVIKRFLREAKLASRLSHPNAVAVLDFGQTDDGVFYLVMELVAGRTLDQVFKAEKVFKAERVVRIGAQVCDALEGAHALSIVHRDLKPANIMLLNRGRDLVKVLDFGLAKSVAPDQTLTTMTNAGALLGTPAFMPPELALGEPCDGRADLYSLGCVLYLLGSGRLPFQSSSAHELIAMHASDPAPPMTGMPPALAAVIDRMLEKDPARRYQTAAENREALEAALDARLHTPALGVPVAAETNPSIGPFPKTTADLVTDDTIPPTPPNRIRTGERPRSVSELHKLVSGDTMSATNDTLVKPPRASAVALEEPSAPPAQATPPRTRKWLVPAIAIGVLAVGGGVFALTRGVGAGSQPAQPAQPVVQPKEPAKPVETQPEIVEPPEPPPAPVEVAKPPAPEPKSPPVPATVKKATTKPKPVTKRTATTATMTTTTTKPVETPQQGSAKPALPF